MRAFSTALNYVAWDSVTHTAKMISLISQLVMFTKGNLQSVQKTKTGVGCYAMFSGNSGSLVFGK